MTDCDTCGSSVDESSLWTLTVQPPRFPPIAGNVEIPTGRLLMCNQCVAAMINRDLRQVR